MIRFKFFIFSILLIQLIIALVPISAKAAHSAEITKGPGSKGPKSPKGGKSPKPKKEPKHKKGF